MAQTFDGASEAARPTAKNTKVKTTQSNAFMSVDTLADQFPQGTTLTTAGQEYDRLMTEAIPNVMTLHACGGEGRVFMSNDKRYGIIIIYTETFAGSITREAAAAMSPKFVEEARRQGAFDALLRSVVVTPEDYHKIDRMMINFRNSLNAASNPIARDATIKTLSTGANGGPVQFRVITAPDVVRNYFERRYGHATIPRCDVGGVLCIVNRDGSTDETGRPTETLREIAGFCGYTTFRDTKQAFSISTNVKYKPIVTLTGLHSDIPIEGMASLLIPIAATYLIQRYGYLRPYSSYSKKGPNLGMLAVNQETGKPFFVADERQRNGFINEYLDAPVFAMDVTEGRDRLNGIDHYAEPDGLRVKAALSKFFSPILANGAIDPALKTIMGYEVENIGIVKTDGTWVDSRCEDYLDLAARGCNIADLAPLLAPTMNPNGRLNFLSKYHDVNDIKPLYVNYRVIFAPAFVQELTRLLDQAHLNLTYDTIAANGGYERAIYADDSASMRDYIGISTNNNTGSFIPSMNTYF